MVESLGNLFILSAPSGAGKSSLIKALLSRHTSEACPMQVSVSHTTRAPRPGEVEGEHYYFVDRSEFESLAKQQAFFEWAEVFGNYYGTSRPMIEGQLAKGIDVFLDIDWQGARQVKTLLPQAKSIFILPPSLETLCERLHKRGQDSDEVIASRMQVAENEMQHYNEFDYLLVNDDFEQTLSELYGVVLAQRCRAHKQKRRHQQLIHSLLHNKSS